MNNLFNTILTWFVKQRIDQIQEFVHYPVETQYRVFKDLIKNGRDTEWGRKYHYRDIRNEQDYRRMVPLQDYETLKPWIERVMRGEQNLLWPTEIKWFAKSSGTTSAKSKFIPVSKEGLEGCHFKGGKDVLSVYCNNYPDAEIFSGKGLIMGGSHSVNQLNSNSYYGDVSAVMMQNMPFLAQMLRTPDLSIALMEDWEEKIDKMARTTIEENVTHIAGVPTWTIVLIKRIFEITGKSDLREVWPNLQLYMHGGVSFTPYKEQFKDYVAASDMHFLETYNASEGFIGLQNEPDKDDMLLMLDYGIFYEFLPVDQMGKEHPETVLLDDVELGKNYAVIISTNSGLWRYNLGDTVRFTSKYPFKIRVSGRVKHFINAFGEEVVVDNSDKAVAIACEQTMSKVREYTVAPIYFSGDQNGGHEWLIEFEKQPTDIGVFIQELDGALKSINSDYEAKRYKDIALQPPKVRVLDEGAFYHWLKDKGKLGGQHKIPRLSNTREYVDEILALVHAKQS